MRQLKFCFWVAILVILQHNNSVFKYQNGNFKLKNKMKKINLSFLFVLFLFSTLNFNNCIGQWVQCSGIASGSVNTLLTSGGSIFAGTNNGVYISTNMGLFWSQTSLNNTAVNSFVISGSNIFAGTLKGIYQSTNNGLTWTIAGMINKEVWSLIAIDNNIFAGTYGDGVYISTNSGLNWAQTSFVGPWVYTFAVIGSKIFAGTYGYGIYFSTNNGLNWSQTTLSPNLYVRSFATRGNSIYVGSGTDNDQTGLFFSANTGSTWYSTVMNNKAVLSLAVSGTSLLAGTHSANGVYLSTNNCITWISKNEGFSIIPPVKALLISGNYILAGTDNYGIWRRSLTEVIGIQSISTEVPSAFSLFQNYPNPFNQSTIINFQCSMNSNVILKVFDITGKEVATLVNEVLQPGFYEVRFDAPATLSSGIYFYKLTAGEFVETRRILLIK